MLKNNTSSISKIEQNFRRLIIEKCKFCGFDKYLEENPDFELPKITEDLLGWQNAQHLTISGMFGGFDYFVEEQCGKLVLYAEQSSRMDHSSDDYLYFEVTLDGNRLLQEDERKVIAERFRELSKMAAKKHTMKLKEMRSNHESSQRK